MTQYGFTWLDSSVLQNAHDIMTQCETNEAMSTSYTNPNKAHEALWKFKENQATTLQRLSSLLCYLVLQLFSLLGTQSLWFELDWTCGHCVAGAVHLQTLLKTLKLTPQDLSLVLLFLATKQRLEGMWSCHVPNLSSFSNQNAKRLSNENCALTVHHQFNNLPETSATRGIIEKQRNEQ